MYKKKVVVGMSGGVDSSVAAYLLKEQGYDVIGVTMQIWQDDKDGKNSDAGCCGLSAVEDARRVADKLDIPYYVMNFKDEFKNKVIDYFIDEYMKGRTPNPCIVCNRYIKWENLLDKSLNIGCDYIATGHYARVSLLPNGRYALKVSKSALKDQTYALYKLTQKQLSRTLMPVGGYEKEQIRQIARQINLRTANKPDSQEICFVSDKNYAAFIEENTGIKPEEGSFVDASGKVLGKHRGISRYTIGQRKGLGIALGYPVFVKEIRADSNEVVLGTDFDVYSDSLTADSVNWMSIEGLKEGESLRAKAKIRYSHKGEYCTVKADIDGKISVSFDSPVRAVTPGQAVVFYDEEGYVIGGASILNSGTERKVKAI
ncbi:tRNA 2-thiouridine(34) synthase MnmA [Johnsonella ignava]|uniref:tRNA 2-thiouridine(34) synthase MnmA n=1 Tax=Johnsonella ignava TaxID=43995 RepID=UPI0023F56230|nr:tRNA 2-thiouridine(34) synthase MnmA [Johnsonella ignava]